MSAALHPRDFIGYGANPPQPRWPGDARLALNICINYEEGSEPSVPDGDAASESGLTEGGAGAFDGRDLAAESMFEYGSRVGFWRITRLLAERGLPATIFGCALALERNPEVCAAIGQLGYDVCAHGWRWERHQFFSEAEERERIRRTVESITRTVGQRPLGWYCRYGPGLNTRRLVREEGGFLYDSDAYNDELPYWLHQDEPRPHLVVPYSLANNDAKFMRGGMSTGQQFFDYLKDSFDMLYREGRTAPKMMSVGVHLRVAGHPGRAAGFERFLDHVRQHPDVWVCGRADIARHWHTHHAPT
ncbi:MAG: chitin deacetylase [Rhodoferax sp.]|nr:chitin deacetylase [Rhodoferax sp.]